MKKSIITLTVVALVIGIFASCSKSKSTTTTPTATNSTFTFSGYSFTETGGKDTTTNDFFGASGNLLYAVGTTGDKQKVTGVYLIFPGNGSRPAAGSYTVANTLQANTVGILINDSLATIGQGLYSNDSITSYVVTVTSNGGKLSASIPSMKLKGFFTPVGPTSNSYNDSITFSGTITEQ